MSVIRSLTALLRLDVSNFTKNLPVVEKKNTETQKKIRKENKKTAVSFNDVSKSASLLKGALAGIITGAFLTGVANATKGNEKIIASFNAITDDSYQARVAFEEFNALSRNMTQSFDEITQSVLALGKTGIKPTTDMLSALGSIADGTGKSLMTVTESVSNAILGQLDGLRQLGIVAVKEGDKLRVTFKGNTQLIENNAESIKGYIQGIAKSDFAGVTEQQMNGLTGAFKRVGDAWGDFLFSFGDSGLGDVIKEGVLLAVDLLDGLSKFINENEWFSAISSDLATTIKNFRKDIGWMVKYYTASNDAITDDSDSTWGSIGEYTNIYFGNFFSLLKLGTSYVIAFLDSMRIGFSKQFSLIFNITKTAVSSIYKAFSGLGSALAGFITDIMEGNFTGITDRMSDAVAKGFKSGMAEIKTISGQVSDFVDDMLKPLSAVDLMAKEMSKEAMENEKKRYEEARKRAEARKKWSESIDRLLGGSTGTGTSGGTTGTPKFTEKDTWSKYYDKLLQDSRKYLSDAQKLEADYFDKLAELESVYNENKIVSEEEKNNAVLLLTKDYLNKRAELEASAKEFLTSLDPVAEEMLNIENEYTEKLAILEQYHNDALISEEEYLVAINKLQEKYSGEKTKAETKQRALALESMTEPYKKIGEATSSMSDAFQDLSEAMENSGNSYKALFAIQKGFAVASATMDAIQAWMKALNDPEAVTWYQRLANYASAVAMTTGILSRLSSVTMHDTGGHITAGEYGIVGEYGPELVRGPATITSRKDTASGSDIIVNLYEDSSRAGTVESSESDDQRIINIFVSDIRRGGDMANAIQNTYNLKRLGA